MAFAAVLLTWPGASSAARRTLRAVDPISLEPRPYVPVRVGEETRLALAPSGRLRLAERPAFVGAGGRVFVFAGIPHEYEPVSFEAEMLLWVDGAWHRRRTLYKEAGRVGTISATIVDEALPPGPIATAVYARTAEPGRAVETVTEQVEVAAGARLDFGFALDEADLGGLAPVVVSVAAEPVSGGIPSGEPVPLYQKLIVPKPGENGWVNASASLDSVEGKQVRFVFRAAAREAGSRLAPHVAWSVPALVTPGRRPPSFVVVSLDGVRARSMSCCGETRPVTPFLDRLFEEKGVIFERAITQSVETIPAHMTLLTGLYPSVHGVQGVARALGPGVMTLPQILRQAGYATAGFTDGAGLAWELGFGRGFEAYREDFTIRVRDVDGWADETLDRALRWIERHRDVPFFVFIHTTEALPPHVPPRGYLGLFKDARLDSQGSIDEGALVRYEREIRHLDDAMKAFVSRLDRLVDPESLYLVVTSGHGEEFLEHGAREAGTHLYEETLRVPLMIRGPGLRAGRRYAGTIGLIDLPPTLLELAGLDAPAEMQGRSVASALRSGLPYSLPPRFSEARGRIRLGRDGPDEQWRPPAYAVSDATHKVIAVRAGQGEWVFEAFDLIADPLETNDVSSLGSTGAPWIGKLEERLRGYPTACRQAARPTVAVGILPIASRFKMVAHGYLEPHGD
ncbi:MAG: hypothetical protein D6815_09650 [Candidatus Dadabacteria bacterium]|nr:MAG: hypothetical protein D6815_09650 [Candidatus Dadabacteria bacterium]